MSTTTELAEHLLETAPDHSGWSLVESQNAAGHYEVLLQWATDMPLGVWRRDAQVRPHHLGLVLLWLESEAGRRHGGEGAVWPVLSDQKIVPWNPLIYSELFNTARAATPAHKDLLYNAARHYSLRHHFNNDEGQNWYRLIYLQFGFTHDDAVQRLAPWLSGQGLPVSVNSLLKDGDSGALAFQQIWRSLRMFRLGNLNKAVLEHRLKSNFWVLPEWCPDLVEAARKSTAQAPEMEDFEAAEPRFFTAPQLFWPELGQPLFTTSICNLEELKLEATDYQFKAGDHVLARLIRQTDGSYHSDAAEAIPLSIEPTVALSIVGDDGQITAHNEAVLWDTMEEVTLYSCRSGAKIQAGERIRAGAAVFLIATGDVTILPEPANSVDLPFGYRLHRIAAGWVGQLEARLDDDLIWTSTSGASALPPGVVGVSARFVRTLDLASADWNQAPSPWRLPIQIRIPDGCTFTRLRWRRSDGYLVETSEIPSHLTLKELDTVRPLTLRVRIISGGRSRTEVLRVPVPFVAALRWAADGKPHHHPPSRKLLLGEARQQIWSFSLPAGRGEPRDPRLSSFLEGTLLHCRLKSRPSRLPDLAGYGAPLHILEHPYGDRTPLLTVAPCVLDDGVLGSVTWLQEEGGFHIKSRLTQLGEQHRLFVWHSDGEDKSMVEEIPHGALGAKEDGWLWRPAAVTRVHAVALEFRGVRLGSWFDHRSWSEAAVKAPPGTPAWTAAMLCAWKAPLLQSEGSHFQNMVDWIGTHWVELLPVWLASRQQKGPGGTKWKVPEMTTHWPAVVNELLTAVLPAPDDQTARSTVQALAPGAGGADALGCALWKLVDVCPILAARIARVYLNNFVPPADQQRLLTIMLACPDFSVSDERAVEIGKIHGNRDDFWLRQTVPTLAGIDERGTEATNGPYRLLSKTKVYRLYALGRWLREIRRP